MDTDQNHIRLMHLAPASHEDAIRCRFTVASLDDQPHYQALSYVWGDFSGSHFVKIEDRPIPITDNLHSVLRRLRLQEQERTLWVDALCINQSDLRERMDQVSRMTAIYGQASQVIVWLGESWNGSDTAMEFLRKIGNDGSLHLDPSLSPNVAVDGLTLESSELCGHLIRLFDLPWWKRTWTVQEFVLAQKLDFQCGGSLVTGDEMYMARENFWSHKDRCCPRNEISYHHPELEMSLATAFEVPARLDFISKSRGDSYSVLLAMASFCKQGVTDPRDRIYGMLGLGTGEYANLVQPDYALSPEQVCEAMAIKSVERTGRFEFLSHLFKHQNPNLPSFIPNWTGNFEWNEVYNMRLGHVKSFNASLDMRADFKLISRGMLAAQGVMFDIITATCPASLYDNFRRPNYWKELTELACLEKLSQELYCHTSDSRLLAFWHTLNGGMEMILEDSNRYSRQLRGSTELSKWLKFSKFMTSPPQSRAELWDNELGRIALDIETATQGRRFFTTKGGHFGLAPQECNEGDIVVVLLGGNVPYVIRSAPPKQSKRCFTILGDSYVHGIMYGEVFERVGTIARELEEIVLV